LRRSRDALRVVSTFLAIALPLLVLRLGSGRGQFMQRPA
jgi:hypothetical protein